MQSLIIFSYIAHWLIFYDINEISKDTIGYFYFTNRKLLNEHFPMDQENYLPTLLVVYRIKMFIVLQLIDRKRFIDLRIGDDMKQIDLVKEVTRVIDTSDLKKHIDETFQETDFSVKEFHTENYPKNSQAYLIEAEFYCRKAREYRAKEKAATAEAEYYGDLEKMYATDKESRDIKEQSKIVSLFLKVCLLANKFCSQMFEQLYLVKIVVDKTYLP